jgi:hypothetical protein
MPLRTSDTTLTQLAAAKQSWYNFRMQETAGEGMAVRQQFGRLSL